MRTGTVTAGEVELFHRRLGESRGAGAPVLILHGAGYYDSADWVEVGSALSERTGRQVVAFDARGYGHSSRSPSGDYTADTQVGDILALLDGLGWDRAVLLGHSRGGAFALRCAAAHPDRVAAAIFADACPGRTARGPVPAPPPAEAGPQGVAPSGGGPGGPAATDPVHADLAAALASTSRDPRSLEDPAKRARLAELFVPVPGGVQLAWRDPAALAGGGSPFDGWAALAAIAAPTLIIRARRSLSFDDAAVARVRREAPRARLVELDAGHDLANEAPAALVGAVAAFLAQVG